MDPANARTLEEEAIAFEDGFGTRCRMASATGADGLEALCLRSELTAVPSFEFALRERVNRLAHFHHASYAPVHSVERLEQAGSTLGIVSKQVPGVRLSKILADAERRGLPLDINTAIALIRQLVPAAAALHQLAPDVVHGSFAPERIVITPNAYLVIVEYVLGGAVEQLRYSQARYWTELRVALPQLGTSLCFDHRADVAQIGLVALALILGRPIATDEYPARIGSVVGSAWAVSAGGGFLPLPAGLRWWLSRALQLDARNSFRSCADANAELDNIVDDGGHAEQASALEAFLRCYHASSDSELTAGSPVPSPAAARPAPSATASNTASSVQVRAAIPAPPVSARPVQAKPVPTAHPTGTPRDPDVSRPAVVVSPMPVAPIAARPAVEASNVVTSRPAASTPPVVAPRVPAPAAMVEPTGNPGGEATAVAEPTPTSSTTSRSEASRPAPNRPEEIAIGIQQEDEPRPRLRPRLPLAVAVVVVGLVVSGALGIRRYLIAGPDRMATGTVVITTNPSGVPIAIDGQPKGTTPVTVTLNAGAHVLKLLGANEPRTIPLNVTAGTQVSEYIEPRRTEVGTGQFEVRTEPAGARVTIDGQLRGTSPLTIDDLTLGAHTVSVENGFRSLSQEVSVEAGATKSLIMSLSGPSPSAPLSGWVSVTTPVDTQLYENGRLIGNSRIDRIMMPAGRHDVEIVNETLQYRVKYTVEVMPGKVSPIKLEWPKGTISLNALPWADVWVDGEKIGETPIGNLALPIGPHEIVFRHPELGERMYAISTTASSPTRLSVDMTKK